MIGIQSYGAYIPPTRLSFASMAGRPAVEDGPEKAVAWNDEDSVTMAVAAALNCLRGLGREEIDGLFFASTTYPFMEKQGASLIARALDLPRSLRTADYAGSLRAGLSALRGALDAVAAGSARKVLVVASDCRMAAPRSALEMNFGDGAAAFLISADGVIASLESSHAIAEEILDLWRSEGDPYVHTWEDRFVIQEGYLPQMVEAVQGLLHASGTTLADYAKVMLCAPDKRSHGTAARALKLDPTRIQDPLFGKLGSAGAAFAGLQLAAALESAAPGDRLLLASHGDGAEAASFEVGAAIAKLPARRGVSWHLARRRAVPSYDHYLKARGLHPSEWTKGSDPGLSATIHYRERDADLSFCGQRCNACGTVQFPAQRVCDSCFAKDDFARLRLSDKVGKVVTYTFDYFFPTPDPPTVVTISEIEGARIHLQLVDCPPEQVAIDMPIEPTFRRIHDVGGRPNYFWKGIPLPEDA
ncbi:MAG: 3-hydroxy-3-methylglutaryl CoA synthase [Deltaproteobacteria bacterium]|nr:3-hydroxy-3-methylglutaryl CoA synthase [Deltaproteobacteria bacterium]